ncbi:hypothetical protein vseg_020815 [Gypsophila vaccaria]
MDYLRKLVDESAKLLNEAIIKLEKEAAKAKEQQQQQQQQSSSTHNTTPAASAPNNMHYDGNSDQPQPTPNSSAPEDEMTQAQKNELSNMRVQMMQAQTRRMQESAQRMGCIGTNSRIVYYNNLY